MADLVLREHLQAGDAPNGSQEAHSPAKISYTTPRDAILARYFALTDDVAFEAIEDGDGTPLDRLKELRADVHSEEGNRPGRRILRDVLDELIDWHTPARG